MTVDFKDDRISPDVLAEQWYSLFHGLMGDVRSMFRQLAKDGLTQKIIAQRLGKKNPEVISRALSGKKNLTIRYLHDLARAMDCRLEVTITRLSDVPRSNRSEARTEHTTLGDNTAATGGFPSINYFKIGELVDG